MSETAAQPALKPRGAARDRLVRRGRIAERAREESDDSADEADDATGASDAGQGEDAPEEAARSEGSACAPPWGLRP